MTIRLENLSATQIEEKTVAWNVILREGHEPTLEEKQFLKLVFDVVNIRRSAGLNSPVSPDKSAYSSQGLDLVLEASLQDREPGMDTHLDIFEKAKVVAWRSVPLGSPQLQVSWVIDNCNHGGVYVARRGISFDDPLTGKRINPEAVPTNDRIKISAEEFSRSARTIWFGHVGNQAPMTGSSPELQQTSV